MLAVGDLRVYSGNREAGTERLFHDLAKLVGENGPEVRLTHLVLDDGGFYAQRLSSRSKPGVVPPQSISLDPQETEAVKEFFSEQKS